jgi:UDP-GlcNAc:undecaprenyl-phosphate GlcNAc-1-phosphate transferase
MSFILAFLIALIITPYSKRLAIKIGAIDEPKDRGVHNKPMPLAGGTAIVLGFIITIVLFSPAVEGFEAKNYIGFIGGGLIITLVGLLDDIYDIKARIKLIFQLVAALLVVFSGITIDVVSWPYALEGVIMFAPLVSKIITVLWIIGVTNAVNLIDGLDGLATGVSTIASLCLMFISILYGEPITVLLTAALAGSCMGFLPHNFSPATIFMGDTGSTFLGFTLSVISIHGLIKSYTAITIMVAVVVLGLPILDTFFAIVRRLINKKPVMQADRGHLHHRLVDKGYSHKKAVLTLYGISSIFGVAGILVAMDDIMIATIIISLMLIIWLIDIFMTKKKEKKC